ncbi:Hypothetical predicted protein [Mytilus galloprovincialis]|uniref:Sulfotransferase domain-containing protein n=1 Tax=Mytilus galloprovincialis TaxID=29158 RepID=A0A8B6CNK8_MYTGA|nr:Hypothetical predicted protein [Mytilus galloprovincialis]
MSWKRYGERKLSWKQYGERKLSWKRDGKNSHGQISTRKNFIDLFDVLPQRLTYRYDIDMYYSHFVTGHGDPMDIWYPYDWTLIPQNNPTSEEPVYVTTNLIYHLNPNIKLILVIRDPAESNSQGENIVTFLSVKERTIYEFIRIRIINLTTKLDEVGPYVLEKMACRELEYKTNYRSPIMNETRSLLETFYYDSQRDMDSILEEYGIDLSLQPQNEIASSLQGGNLESGMLEVRSEDVVYHMDLH